MDSKEILYALQKGVINISDAEKEITKIMGTGVRQSVEKPSSAKLQQLPSIEPSSLNEEDLPSELLLEPTTASVVDVQEISPGIVQITMHDRMNKNTFSMDLIIGLVRAFRSIQMNPDCKVIILTGYDSYFACGGSQEGLLALYEGKIKMTDVNIYSLPLDCEIPVIAAMQGHAIGGGWCLGMFCDFIVMSRESSYTCNHMKYGFTPGDGATLIFPEKLGFGLAQEILFTGKKYRGSELESKGIPIPVLSKKEVLPYAIQLAKDLAEVPRQSLALLKAHMTTSMKTRLSSILENEWKMQEQTFLKKPEVLQNILSSFGQLPQRQNEEKKMSASVQSSELIHLNQCVQGRPVFWLHGDGGGVEGYQIIAQKIQRPFYGIQARGRMSAQSPLRGIPAMASYYLQLMQAVQPEGPYDIGGYSLGGALAYEIARQLQVLGQTVHTIVMLDSLDATGMQKVALSQQATILQAVNLSLMNRIRQEPEKLLQKLIHQQDVDFHVADTELLQQLILLGKTRGLSVAKTETELFNLFQKNLQVQQAFETDQFSILPLPDPHATSCYYFRNKSGLFYGNFQPYLTGTADKISVDHTNYWQEWEQHLPNFHLIEVDASNHITLLFEPKGSETIGGFCQDLYMKNSVSGNIP